MPEYEHAHAFLDMLDSTKGLAPGDPKLMALLVGTKLKPFLIYLPLVAV